MANITSSAAILDFELAKEETPIVFDFVKFDSDPFNKKNMKWDSDNAISADLIGLLFKNVKDSKTLTIMKKQEEKVEKYIKNAKVKKLKGDKKGGIDFFQVRFKVDGTAQSVILKNPSVIHTETILENKVPYFLFTLKTDVEPTISGVGMTK